MEEINKLTEKIIAPENWDQAIRSLTFFTLCCVSVSLWQYFNWR
jgi:hypothetical protein